MPGQRVAPVSCRNRITGTPLTHPCGGKNKVPTRIIRDGVLDSDRYHSLPNDARLAFFELLLVADDYGLAHLSHVWLRRRCPVFEGKSTQFITSVIGALADQDLIRCYVVDGVTYGYIPRFGNRPQALRPKFPIPPAELGGKEVEALMPTAKNLTRKRINELQANEQGVNPVGTGCESPELRISNIELRSTKDVAMTSSLLPVTDGDRQDEASKVAKANGNHYTTPSCPYSILVDLYHKHLPTGRKIETINPSRKRAMQARWREVCDDEHLTREQGIKWFAEFFAHAAESPFLTSKVAPPPGRKQFQVSLDFLFNPTRFTDTVEGKYNR